MQFVVALSAVVSVFATSCGVDGVETTSQEISETTNWAGPVPLSPAGWDASVRYNFGKELAIDQGGVIHVAWLHIQGDDTLPQVQGEIYYQRSTTGGMSWSAPLRLSTGPALVSFPKIAVFGPYAYVVWHANTGGVATSYIALSTNQGQTFGAPSAVTTEHAAMPAVAANGSGVHVVFTGPTNEIFVTSSIDFGVTWRPTRQVSSADNHTSWTPVVAANGPAIYVAWTDERHNRNPDGTSYDCGKEPPPSWAGDDGCREEIYFRRSTDLGATWSAEQRLTTSAQNVGHNAASLVFASNALHISYFRKPAGSYGVFYQRSLDAGATFSTPTPITSSGTTIAMRPSVAAFNNMVGIAYSQVDSGIGARLYYAHSNDQGATFGAAPKLVVPGNGLSMQPSLEFDPVGQAHIVFTDATGPNASTDRVFYARTIPN